VGIGFEEREKQVMAGPFPGVDPYLENFAYWRGFHNGLITFITATLNAILPVGYAANYEERVYIIPPERSIYPAMKPCHSLTGPEIASESVEPHGIMG
jgi:hypothetical protein